MHVVVIVCIMHTCHMRIYVMLFVSIATANHHTDYHCEQSHWLAL
jgi:hypothetical protein